MSPRRYNLWTFQHMNKILNQNFDRMSTREGEHLRVTWKGDGSPQSLLTLQIALEVTNSIRTGPSEVSVATPSIQSGLEKIF